MRYINLHFTYLLTCAGQYFLKDAYQGTEIPDAYRRDRLLSSSSVQVSALYNNSMDWTLLQ